MQDKKRGPEWDLKIPSDPSRLRRETAFICNIRFKNDLPEVLAAAAGAAAAVGQAAVGQAAYAPSQWTLVAWTAWACGRQ